MSNGMDEYRGCDLTRFALLVLIEVIWDLGDGPLFLEGA